MKYNPAIHHRRSIRLKGYNYSQAGLYFITICTQNRVCLFGFIENCEMVLNGAGNHAIKCWLAIPKHYPNTRFHEYIVMPNHIHGIIEITVGANNHSPLPNNTNSSNHVEMRIPSGTSKTIGAMVRGFKIGVTKWFRGNMAFGGKYHPFQRI